MSNATRFTWEREDEGAERLERMLARRCRWLREAREAGDTEEVEALRAECDALWARLDALDVES